MCLDPGTVARATVVCVCETSPPLPPPRSGVSRRCSVSSLQSGRFMGSRSDRELSRARGLCALVAPGSSQTSSRHLRSAGAAVSHANWAGGDADDAPRNGLAGGIYRVCRHGPGRYLIPSHMPTLHFSGNLSPRLSLEVLSEGGGERWNGFQPGM